MSRRSGYIAVLFRAANISERALSVVTMVHPRPWFKIDRFQPVIACE